MSNTFSILHLAAFTPGDEGWGLQILFWGGAGVAKSAIIAEFAQQWAMRFQHLPPGELGEGFFGAIPVPTKRPDGSVRISHPAPEWVDKFVDEDGIPCAGIVFPDELTTADRGIKPALLSVLYNRRVGGHYFGPRVRVLAAANPPEIAANGSDLSVPEANRVCHVEWETPSPREWRDYHFAKLDAKTNGVAEAHDALAEEQRVMERWDAEFRAAMTMVEVFHQRRPGYWVRPPKKGEKGATRAWPSIRSWTLATRIQAGAVIHKTDEAITDQLIEGCVGPGAFKEYATFRESLDLPDIDAYLDGKCSFEHNPDRLDRSFVVYGQAAARINDPSAPNRIERAKRFVPELLAVAKDTPDVIYSAAQTLHKTKLKQGDKEVTAIRISPKGPELLTTLHGLIELAGESR